MVAARPGVARLRHPWLPVLLAALAMFVVGVLDDRLQLSPLAKLVARWPSARSWSSRSPAPSRGRAAVDLHAGRTMWFAGICHALNLLDNMDGLAAGIGADRRAILALAARPGARARRSSVLLVALAGALLGFLSGTVRRRGCSWATAGASSSARCSAGASLVPVFNTRHRVRQPGGARRPDPDRAALRHGVRARAAPAGRAQGHARAAPTTCRTGSCRSGSPSAAPCASCICSGWSGGATAWVLIARQRRRADAAARGAVRRH